VEEEGGGEQDDKNEHDVHFARVDLVCHGEGEVYY
jgi:hypothetical protein